MYLKNLDEIRWQEGYVPIYTSSALRQRLLEALSDIREYQRMDISRRISLTDTVLAVESANADIRNAVDTAVKYKRDAAEEREKNAELAKKLARVQAALNFTTAKNHKLNQTLDSENRRLQSAHLLIVKKDEEILKLVALLP